MAGRLESTDSTQPLRLAITGIRSWNLAEHGVAGSRQQLPESPEYSNTPENSLGARVFTILHAVRGLPLPLIGFPKLDRAVNRSVPGLDSRRRYTGHQADQRAGVGDGTNG